MLIHSVYVLLMGLCYASIVGLVSSSEAHPGYDSGTCDVGISASIDQGRILDISHAYREDIPVWDSSEGLGHYRWLAASMKNGSIANNSEMKMGTHTGTHVDAPGHVFEEYYDAGFDVDTLDLRILNGHALLVDVPRETNITAKVMEGLNIPRGVHRVLFRTLNTDRRLMWKREFDTSYVGFMKDGAQWLVDGSLKTAYTIMGRKMSMPLSLALAAVAIMSTLCCYVSAQQGAASIITEDVFNQFLKHRNDAACPAKGFYTYNAFVAAAKTFPNFGNNGDIQSRKRELAAFFGQTSQETGGGGPSSVDGRYAWGYCFKEELNNPDKYKGRGPIMLTGNSNYKAAGAALGYDLINKPELVATDATVTFRTAMWFWMTAQSPKPSCHDVILGRWSPSNADTAAGRVAGFGMLTNIINGGVECGLGTITDRQQGRIGFYQRYCSLLGVGTGSNLDCKNQKHY